METSQKTKANTVNGMKVIVLFTLLSFNAFIGSGQGLGERDSLTEISVNNSMNMARPLKPVYLGYELGLGVPLLTINSDISKLNGLRIPSLGARVGGVMGSAKGKLKGYGGLYYPDSTVPYDFDLLEVGASASVYVLRLNQTNYHTLEPYVLTDLNYQVLKYYGSYLADASEAGKAKNNDALLGSTKSTNVRVGAGVEFQLESDQNKFLHLFAETGMGIQVNTSSKNESFSSTSATNQFWIAVGVNFGIIK